MIWIKGAFLPTSYERKMVRHPQGKEWAELFRRRFRCRKDMKGRFIVTSHTGSRPQPDEFYPKPPATEPNPSVPTPPETPEQADPLSAPSVIPEQVSEPEKRPLHPMPPPEVP